MRETTFLRPTRQAATAAQRKDIAGGRAAELAQQLMDELDKLVESNENDKEDLAIKRHQLTQRTGGRF